ncbi:DUF192 domain-containing protein [Pararhizobium haloflavum]|uniref:DUF192 domain-containing protein n=1 Tax=Pararhizobium haloflavum TaxID=2037914 RepID=UPI000C19D087|nr:DUF192 domain-containing protein [Pararhizobium haloflavum]
MFHVRPLALGAAVALCACLPILAVAQEHETSADPLVIETADGQFDYTVELALDGRERAIGLMNRESMEDDHGMLFRFESVRPVSMWMKNTLIPLDMLFIREDGTVAGFHENAEPMSETVISAPEPIRYVLELNGGTAEEIGLAEGDRVSHPVIDGTD